MVRQQQRPRPPHRMVRLALCLPLCNWLIGTVLFHNFPTFAGFRAEYHDAEGKCNALYCQACDLEDFCLDSEEIYLCRIPEKVLCAAAIQAGVAGTLQRQRRLLRPAGDLVSSHLRKSNTFLTYMHA